MKSFNILFHFRGHDRIAMVDRQANAHSVFYSVYFTDVELVLDFGNRIDYHEDGRCIISKKVIAKDASHLHSAVYSQLKDD